MHIMSTASFAESETTWEFETARALHPALVCFHITSVFLLRRVRRLRMHSLLRLSTPPVASFPELGACNFWFICFPNDIWSIKHPRSSLEYTQEGLRTYF